MSDKKSVGISSYFKVPSNELENQIKNYSTLGWFASRRKIASLLLIGISIFLIVASGVLFLMFISNPELVDEESMNNATSLFNRSLDNIVGAVMSVFIFFLPLSFLIYRGYQWAMWLFVVLFGISSLLNPMGFLFFIFIALPIMAKALHVEKARRLQKTN